MIQTSNLYQNEGNELNFMMMYITQYLEIDTYGLVWHFRGLCVIFIFEEMTSMFESFNFWRQWDSERHWITVMAAGKNLSLQTWMFVFSFDAFTFPSHIERASFIHPFHCHRSHSWWVPIFYRFEAFGMHNNNHSSLLFVPALLTLVYCLYKWMFCFVSSYFLPPVSSWPPLLRTPYVRGWSWTLVREKEEYNMYSSFRGWLHLVSPISTAHPFYIIHLAHRTHPTAARDQRVLRELTV